MHDPETGNKMAGINLHFAKETVPTTSKRATTFGLKIFTAHHNLFQYELIYFVDWFSQREEFRTEMEVMEKGKLNEFLRKFSLHGRKKT